MSARSRTPLIVAGVVALGAGVALALALRDDPAPPPAPERTAVRTPEESRAFQLRLKNAGEIPEEMRGGERYMESRWGHLGDAGITMAGAQLDGQRYFIEPKVVQAWTPKGRNYATIIATPFTLDESQRYRGERKGPALKVEDFKPSGALPRLANGYKPITDPNDVPPEHPQLKKVFGTSK